MKPGSDASEAAGATKGVWGVIPPRKHCWTAEPDRRIEGVDAFHRVTVSRFALFRCMVERTGFLRRNWPTVQCRLMYI